jgi:DNA-binding response OmpR family regulator
MRCGFFNSQTRNAARRSLRSRVSDPRRRPRRFERFSEDVFISGRVEKQAAFRRRPRRGARTAENAGPRRGTLPATFARAAASLPRSPDDMNPNRILLVHNDTMLAHCFGEALCGSGFDVYVAPDGPSALKRMPEVQPDLVLLDLVLPQIGGADLMRKIRADKNNSGMPVIALPTHLEPLALAAQDAQATQVLERYANPLAAAINGVEQALGSQPSVLRTRNSSAGVETNMAKMRAGLPGCIIDLRRNLHELASGQAGPRGLPDFFQRVHNFAEEVALLDLQAVVTLAAAIEALTFDINEMPEQLNASTLRTLGQGIDLLGVLLENDSWRDIKHPSDARILVVEDDENARQLITASIELVQLTAVGAATPSSGLKALDAGEFELVFLDIGLPEMNGFDFCTKVRALPQFEKTPIVFLTGMATFQNRAQSSLIGGNDFIGKPFNVRELGVKALIWVYKGQLGPL